ncbi:DNA polymerase III subunit delta [Enterovirga rhinocerotis]|uniref:DNA-directed DNA polymerase n=1 Tax=Enterovirga rhinocerotis TaxID=1339210 RepID=A0A4R7BP30_9HYPH|nr:DNA polymerase III subunit delta [Enterovirga rhinocerotis]TDR87121.1 DNA polymerase III delta subunit [Enterovirga rhinocerotis]
MTAVKAGDVDRAVKARRPDICVLLFYGPDSGRVSERARAAAEAAVSDPADPFQLIRLDGDDLLDHPGKLVEEATTYGLFGERRVIWVRPTSRNIAGPVAACLEGAPDGTLVVVEAGDLGKTSPLRAACEKSNRALALPCYADETRDLATVVTDTLAAGGLRIDADARELLIESLGGDRLASRGELEKLMLYCLGRERVSAEDVAAVVSDVSSQSVDMALDAAFGGDLATLEDSLRQLAQNGVAPAQILILALRHTLQLLSGRAGIDSGSDPEAAVRSWRGLHFRRRNAVERQLARWREPSLRRVVDALQDATLQSRRNPGLAQTVAGAALLRIAQAASRR